MPITSSNIYTGWWTNWSEGKVVGATITVKSDTGSILTAFLAIFVQLTGTHLWHLIAYMIHRAKNTTEECHPIIRQQQVILKNFQDPLRVCIQVCNLMWAWRRRQARAAWYWGNLLILLLALLCASAGIVTGIFSALVINNSDIEVLLSSPNCGFWDTSYDFRGSVLDPLLQAGYLANTEGQNGGILYGRQCYNATSLKECNAFTVPSIGWQTDYLAPCPFSEKMCIGPAMKMDTGLMNSNHILGLNFAPERQMNLRKVTTCAPITQDDFLQFSNESLDLPGEMWANWYYGQNVELPSGNKTHTASIYAFNRTRSYSGQYAFYWAGDGIESSSFIPIPELNRTDGDGSLFWVSSNAEDFPVPCDDPVFSAHTPAPPSHAGQKTRNETYYIADRPSGVVGCVEQYQFCSATPDSSGTTNCTALDGIINAYGEAFARELFIANDVQNVTLNVLAVALTVHGASLSLNFSPSPPNLRASDTLSTNLQFTLPSNHWQIEVSGWHAAVMATLQTLMTLRVVGPADENAQQFVIPSSTEAEKMVCASQRVRVGQGFSNVSVLGLFIVISVGLLVILSSCFLEQLVGLIGRVTKSSAVLNTRESWRRDDVLHVQRLAYKGQSLWNWTGVEKGQVPLPEEGCMLSPLAETPDDIGGGRSPDEKPDVGSPYSPSFLLGDKKRTFPPSVDSLILRN